MGNESPEATAIHIEISLLQDEIEKFLKFNNLSKRDKDIIDALTNRVKKHKAELAALESNTTDKATAG